MTNHSACIAARLLARYLSTSVVNTAPVAVAYQGDGIEIGAPYNPLLLPKARGTWIVCRETCQPPVSRVGAKTIVEPDIIDKWRVASRQLPTNRWISS